MYFNENSKQYYHENSIFYERKWNFFYILHKKLVAIYGWYLFYGRGIKLN